MSSRPFVLTLWTHDVQRAGWAARHGVQRIGLDLEQLGKARRQQGLPTWISPHTIDDLDRIAPVRGASSLFVRCNALHAGSAAEVDTLVARGVQVLMLPNFVSAAAVEAFLRLVDGRAQVVPLFERVQALGALDAVHGLGIAEVHVGLNDLSIDLGLRNRLVALALPELAAFCERARGLGVRFGLGGLGLAGDTSLPVPSDLVYAQHARLGSSGALLARSFFGPGMNEAAFGSAVQSLHQRIDHWRHAPAAEREAARVQLLQHAGVPT